MWALCQLYIHDVVTQAYIIIATVKYRYYRYSPTVSVYILLVYGS